AIRELAGMGEAVVRAADAGHDLLLVCHTEPAQRQAHAALLDAARTGALPRRALEASAARIEALVARRGERATDAPPRPERDGEALARALATRAATLLAPPPAGWRQRLNGRVLAVVGVEPSGAEIADAVARALAADATLLFLYDAHLYASNRALLDALTAAAPALGVVLLRDPYDAACLAPGVAAATAYGWRRCQVEAALTLLVA